MSVYWFLGAAALIAGHTYVLTKGTTIIKNKTSREMLPDPASAARYYAVYFAIALGIGLPPIFLVPNAGVLVQCAFMFARNYSRFICCAIAVRTKGCAAIRIKFSFSADLPAVGHRLSMERA